MLGDSDAVSIRCLDNRGALALRQGRRQDERWVLAQVAADTYFWFQRPALQVNKLLVTPASKLFAIHYAGGTLFLRYVSAITDVNDLVDSFAKLNKNNTYGLAHLGPNLLISPAAEPTANGVPYNTPEFLQDLKGVKNLF